MITDEQILNAFHESSEEEQRAILRILHLEEVKPVKYTNKEKQKIQTIAKALLLAEFASADEDVTASGKIM